mmetsp:Transcript_11628/g.18928  ORF Transcript_11628/g.18928 Transcript_11628/m.18928 type:complete len:105 (+) Transcript_11628:454-768(+)
MFWANMQCHRGCGGANGLLEPAYAKEGKVVRYKWKKYSRDTLLQLARSSCSGDNPKVDALLRKQVENARWRFGVSTIALRKWFSKRSEWRIPFVRALLLLMITG